VFVGKPNKILEGAFVETCGFLHDQLNNNVAAIRMKIIASKFECSGIAESIDGVVQSSAAKLLANSQTAGGHNLLRRIEFVSRDLQLCNPGGGLRLPPGERRRQDANREETDAKVNWCHTATEFHRKSVKRSIRNCLTGCTKK